jgi:carotenoid cleavage dioxygenase-like enzyme
LEVGLPVPLRFGPTSSHNATPATRLPAWLQGDYIRQVPALHGTLNRTMEHLFDGLAKLHCYHFPGTSADRSSNGNLHTSPVTFTARFLRSYLYNHTTDLGELPPSMTLGNVQPPWSPEERLLGDLTTSDNAAINVWALGDADHRSYVATTDALVLMRFDPGTGSSLGRLFLQKPPAESTLAPTTARPRFHPAPPPTRLQAIADALSAHSNQQATWSAKMAALRAIRSSAGDLEPLPWLALLSTAHPHHDVRDPTVTWNVASVINPLAVVAPQDHFHALALYRIGSDLQTRVVAELPLPELHYLHSFSVTEHYAIVLLWPATVDVDALLNSAVILEGMRWNGSSTTRVLVFNLLTGAVELDTPTEPFFAYHHINAWEEGQASTSPDSSVTHLHVDVTHFADIATMWFWLLPNISNATYRDLYPDPTFVRRLTLRLGSNASVVFQDVRVHVGGLSTSGPELPRINYERYNGRPYCFVYGYSGHAMGSPRWSDAAVVKVDLCKGSAQAPAQAFFQPGLYPSEPVFVGRPNATAEDDGVLLVDAFDSLLNTTQLVVLDARDLNVLAVLVSPLFMPWPLHAQFFPKP